MGAFAFLAVQDRESGKAGVRAKWGPGGQIVGGVDGGIGVAVTGVDVGAGGEKGNGECWLASVGGRVQGRRAAAVSVVNAVEVSEKDVLHSGRLASEDGASQNALTAVVAGGGDGRGGRRGAGGEGDQLAIGGVARSDSSAMVAGTVDGGRGP